MVEYVEYDESGANVRWQVPRTLGKIRLMEKCEQAPAHSNFPKANYSINELYTLVTVIICIIIDIVSLSLKKKKWYI